LRANEDRLEAQPVYWSQLETAFLGARIGNKLRAVERRGFNGIQSEIEVYPVELA
jgi:hypothetical protein